MSVQSDPANLASHYASSGNMHSDSMLPYMLLLLTDAYRRRLLQRLMNVFFRCKQAFHHGTTGPLHAMWVPEPPPPSSGGTVAEVVSEQAISSQYWGLGATGQQYGCVNVFDRVSWEDSSQPGRFVGFVFLASLVYQRYCTSDLHEYLLHQLKKY